jgi:hypothetical protein
MTTLKFRKSTDPSGQWTYLLGRPQVVLPSDVDPYLATALNPPRVMVQRSASMGALGAATFVMMTWDQELYDTSNFITGGGRLTVPIAGLYHIDAGVTPVYVANNRVAIRITKNGGVVREMAYGSTVATCGATVSGDFLCASPGDYFEIWVYSQLASSGTQGGAPYNYCGMRWVAPP